MSMLKGRRPGALFPWLLNLFAMVLWAGWLAALLKVFNAWAVLGVGFLLSMGTWRLMRAGADRWLPVDTLKDRAMLAVVVIFILFLFVFNAVLFHDAFQGTRDEGLYSNDAAYLADHGNLPYPSFNGSDSRLFLNVTWYAELYGLGGFATMPLVNVIPVCLALLCVYLLVEELTRRPAAGLAAVAFIAFCYPFLWYLRRTSNEAFFFSLLWIAIYLLFRCLRDRETFRTDFTLFALVLPLTAFVRPEGWLALGVGICAAVYIYAKRGRRRAFPAVLAVLLILLMVGSLAGGYLHLRSKYQWSEFAEKNLATTRPGPAFYSSEPLAQHRLEYSGMVMLEFGLLPALLCLLPFFVLLFLDRRTRAFALFLLLIALPYFYYFYKPNIAFDLPWFMRRFITAVIPLALIAFAVVMSRLPRRPALAVCAAYLGLFLFLSSPILLHHEYQGMIDATADIAGLLPDDVTVLVDRYATGEYAPGGSLFFVYGKDTVSVSPFSKLTSKQVPEAGTVYLVTNESDFNGAFKQGPGIFDDSVQVTGVAVVEQLDASFPYLVPTCDFHRGGYEDIWLRMDYRVALSQVRVPTEVVRKSYRVLVVRMEISPVGS
jgi:hypothetical protein